jgi:hypothetical protein
MRVLGVGCDLPGPASTSTTTVPDADALVDALAAANDIFGP